MRGMGGELDGKFLTHLLTDTVSNSRMGLAVRSLRIVGFFNSNMIRNVLKTKIRRHPPTPPPPPPPPLPLFLRFVATPASARGGHRSSFFMPLINFANIMQEHLSTFSYHKCTCGHLLTCKCVYHTDVQRGR